MENIPLYKDASQPVEARVEDLLSRMTMEEKIGQMTQSYGGEYASEEEYVAAIRAGKIGSRIGCDTPWAGSAPVKGINVVQSNAHQKVAVEESRLGIPLINGRDIIHGHRTVAPIPLAQAASFDPEEVKASARTAAIECSAQSIHWTFAPMMDICRNPRWGRVIETLGEDPYLAEEMAVAMTQGFQGDDQTKEDCIAACAKHFAGYGYCEGGRDYDASEISRGTLHNVVLRPFKAAVTRGKISTIMTSFQDNGGTPSSSSNFLLREMLREGWGFDGFVVSDWGSIQQVELWGAAQDKKDVVRKCLLSGVNMEMINNLYPKYVAELVEEGSVPLQVVDDLVRGILRIKFRLGLFEKPYVDIEERAKDIRKPEAIAAVRKQAANCMVLAENNGILPLEGDSLKGLRIALVGPMVNERRSMGGAWNTGGFTEEFTTIHEAFKEAEKKYGFKLIVHDSELWDAQVRTAAFLADMIICCVGEHCDMTGEMPSISKYRLPLGQDDLIEAVRSVGKPFVVVCTSGRPLPVPGARDFADALLYSWHGGGETARAIVDVIFGEAEPTGRFPITVPEHEGQIPIYYGRKIPGKVVECNKDRFNKERKGQLDKPWIYGSYEYFLPMYPFGYGLSYTEFALSDIKLASAEIPYGGTNKVTAVVENIGNRAGTTVVQCYLADPRCMISRPCKELIGFKKLRLEVGEKREIEFEIGEPAMGFYDENGVRHVEAGEFKIGVGFDSDVDLDMSFTMAK